MRYRVAEEDMEQRRQERLDRLIFFMRDPKTPQGARKVLATMECLNLLQGFFGNSKWEVFWFVFADAIRCTIGDLRFFCRAIWWVKILRRDVEAMPD